jgi:hypothetical protein
MDVIAKLAEMVPEETRGWPTAATLVAWRIVDGFLLGLFRQEVKKECGQFVLRTEYFVLCSILPH